MKSKVLHALLSVAIAFALWVYVITVVSPESEETFYNVPVVLNNETVLNENGLMILSKDAPTVTLKLKGNRKDLNQLKSSDITVMADLSKINEAGQRYLSYSVSFPGMGFEIVNQNPQGLTLNVVYRASKEVDVVVSTTGATPPDFIADLDKVDLSHKKVTITGPQDVVEQITQAVVTVDIEGKKETISESYRYTLCDKDGNPVDAEYVQTNTAEISTTLRIKQVKDLQLLPNVIYGGGATEQNTTIKIEPSTIKVAGSKKLLESLNSLVLDTVNLATLMEDTTLTYTIKLPEGIENISGVENVTVTISFNNLETKKLKISPIVPITGPGMTVTVARPEIEIIVRGTPEQIKNITAADITAKIDCTGAAAGEDKFKPQFTIDPKYDTVGVMELYDDIYATVTVVAS